MRRAVEAVWNSDAPWAAASRAALAPVSIAWRGASWMRNALYERDILRAEQSPIPVVSIGNLAVGGTGKTPMAAWMANALMARGARPAIVMRGYGDDEPQVHRLINPDVPVVVNADRVAAVHDAAAQRRDIAILDDGFQHRRLARQEDIVLVSSDRWHEPIRLLPAGPWREPPSALSRASLVIVTRKAADAASAQSLMQRLSKLTSTGMGAVATLSPDSLHDVASGDVRPLSGLAGRRVLVVAGIGDPDSFVLQLQGAGAIVELRRFPDHHVYQSADIAQLARDAGAFDHILCTLKDAVKLGSRWPREGQPLWYVSLRCEIEVGGADVSAVLDRVLAARRTHD
jgi:tetraacyldisaccharide 4'-kinase